MPERSGMTGSLPSRESSTPEDTVSPAHRAHLETQRQRRTEQSQREARRRGRVREQQAALRAFVPGTLKTAAQLAQEALQRRLDFYARHGMTPPPDVGRGSSPTATRPLLSAVASPGLTSPGEGSRRASGSVTPHRRTSTSWLSRPPAGSPCERCGEPTPPPKPQGRPRVFCSDTCANRAHAARAREKKKTGATPLVVR